MEDEENAGNERNYEKAAELKAERLRAQEAYETMKNEWETAQKLDEVVDVDDVAQIVGQWTGIPVSKLMESERANRRLQNYTGRGAPSQVLNRFP